MSLRSTMTTPQQPKPNSNDRHLPLDQARLGQSTLSVHAGEQRQKPSDAITDSIVTASTYTFHDSQSIIDHRE